MREFFTNEQKAFLEAMCFLFWWKKPEELPESPERTLAGVMDRGGVKEWAEMERIFPRDFLARALETAKCGEFHGWSWKFWRMRLGLDPDIPLPSRIPGVSAPSGKYWHEEMREREEGNEEYERLKWTFAARGIEVKDAFHV